MTSRISRARLTASGSFSALLALALLTLMLSPASAGAGVTGGSYVVIVPKIAKIQCVRGCTRAKGIRPGSTLRLAGENLDVAKEIVFLGARGAEDDVTATVIKAGTRSAVVKVPAGAGTGPVSAATADGTRSRPSAPIAVRPLPPVIGSPKLQAVPGVAIPGVTLETGTSTPRVVFIGAKQLVRYSMRVSGLDGATAGVSLVRHGTGEVAATWRVAVPVGQVVTVEWDGTMSGNPAPSGRYIFTAQITGGGAASAAAGNAKIASTGDRDAFDLYGYMFPVRGGHNFGQSGAKFGGGRGHQGQDIMAACNTKIVAARGGTVVESRSQSAAGNFIVIRPDFGVGDQAYLHMIGRSPFKPGDRVYTGQAIGNVGSTGRSSACHLHFEQWTGEIWRSKPVDPLGDLLSWDQIS